MVRLWGAKPAISIKSRFLCTRSPSPCKWRRPTREGSKCNEQVHGESRAGGLMTGLIVYQQICVFHIKRQTRGVARAGEDCKWSILFLYLNANRTIYYTGKRACYHAMPTFLFPIMPHLVKLLMFYAIKLRFILANNTPLNGGQGGWGGGAFTSGNQKRLRNI